MFLIWRNTSANGPDCWRTNQVRLRPSPCSPLIVPENCGALRVGNTQKAWQEGELLIFDDSMEHEAWNHSDRDRVVLLFDIWRPELSAEERQWVSAMLLAVKSFGEA